jgi:hypothetical protein
MSQFFGICMWITKKNSSELYLIDLMPEQWEKIFFSFRLNPPGVLVVKLV